MNLCDTDVVVDVAACELGALAAICDPDREAAHQLTYWQQTAAGWQRTCEQLGFRGSLGKWRQSNIVGTLLMTLHSE